MFQQIKISDYKSLTPLHSTLLFVLMIVCHATVSLVNHYTGGQIPVIPHYILSYVVFLMVVSQLSGKPVRECYDTASWFFVQFLVSVGAIKLFAQYTDVTHVYACKKVPFESLTELAFFRRP